MGVSGFFTGVFEGAAFGFRVRLVALASVLFVSAVQAETIAAGNPATTGLVGFGQTESGVNLSSVVEIQIAGIGGCSGSLLSDGTSILTAGHCVLSPTYTATAGNVTVYFQGPSGMVSASVSAVAVDPGYNGSNSSSGADLAVLTLTQTAPSYLTGYSLYSGSAALTDPLLMAGYGYGGTGATGYDSSTYPFGTLRAGYNEYTGMASDYFTGYSSSLLVGQFYESGVPSTNALGVAHPYSSSSEVDIAPGDSGGPTFYDGQIIGVHDLAICLGSGSCSEPPSVSSSNDSAFGEIYADTSVADNLAFIDAADGATAPEPGTAWLLGCGIAVAAVGRRRRGSVGRDSA